MIIPDWPTCEYNPDGHTPCHGIQVKDFRRCLAHLGGEQLDLFFATFGRGADLDARGTVINTSLLARLMEETVLDEGDLPVFGNVRLDRAEFDGVTNLGPFTANTLTLDEARFSQSVEIRVMAKQISCVGTRFDNGVTLRSAYATLDLSRAIFGSASSILLLSGSFPRPEWYANWALGRTAIGLASATEPWVPAALSLRGTDVSNLVLADIDLSWCLFAGAYRLDQLRFEGRCRFNSPPGWRSTRQILAEEHLIRIWSREHPLLGDVDRIGYDRVAALYRSLRKAFEDSKNEAEAGDFYYGEMEMRRSSWATQRAVRWILTIYWLLSGYGQRAARALGALVVLVVAVSLLLITVGIPGEPTWTWPRVDLSVRIAMGAVVFREAGQQLTSAGNWTVMIARFLGPFLLILAALAVRARVKR